MPYIKKEDRASLERPIVNLLIKLDEIGTEDNIEGLMNYTVTNLLDAMKVNSDHWRYKHINRVVGVLDCIKMEFYRRLAANYEDSAKETNGDLSIYEWL